VSHACFLKRSFSTRFSSSSFMCCFPCFCDLIVIKTLRKKIQSHRAHHDVVFSITCLLHESARRDIAVGIATCYGLNRQGSNPGVCQDLPHPSRPALGPTHPPVQGYRVPFPGVKRLRRGINHSPPSSAEVKERVERYLNYPSVDSWQVTG
jgi:hypothetical protein